MANARLSRQQVEVIGRLTASLRVGGQSLQVAGVAQNGKLRVHGVWLEYMTKILPEGTSSTIGPTANGIEHDVDVSHVAPRGASSDLSASLDQDVSLAGSVYNRAPGDTIGPTANGIQQSVQVSVVRQLSANSALTLDQDAFIQQPASSDIGIQQSVQVSVVRSLSAGNEITGLDQGTGTNQHMESANNDLSASLDSDVTIVQAYSRSASSNLAATLDQSLTVAIVKPAGNTIGIDHSVQLSVIRNLDAGNQLVLTSGETAFATSHPYPENIIGIDHSVSVRKILNILVVQGIGISHSSSGGGTLRAGCFNVLTGWSWEWNPFTQVYDTRWVTMTSTAEVEHVVGLAQIPRTASSQLNLGHSVSYQAVFNRQPESDINIKQTLGYSYIQDTTFCDYAPSVGSTNPGDPTPPSMVPPTIEPELYDGVQLSYPSVAPTEVIYLRGPELGNVDQFNTQRVNTESRGGTLIIFHVEGWPKVKRMLFSFTGLTEQEGQEVLDFVEVSVGKEVKLRDWEGREWLGVITSTNEPITRNRDTCNLSTDLEFELIDGT